MRTIDADDAIVRIRKLWTKECPLEEVYHDEDYAWGLLDAIDAVDDSPTIEPKRGEWIVYEGEWKDLDYYPPKCKCNQCGYEEDLYILNAKPTNFCPNCGADMREVRNE